MAGQWLERSGRLIGEAALEKLAGARVAVFGIGGVGSYTAEALARGGIGALDIIDDDTVAESNLNRQLFATHSTLGMDKVTAAEMRLKDIAPHLKLTCHKLFFTTETEFDLSVYDYVVDAIDSVAGKIELAVRAQAAGVPIISAMGAGNKLDATAFEVTDLAKTSVCPLAKVMRYELRKRGVEHMKVVYSKEVPLKPTQKEGDTRRATPGSMSYVPGVVGLIIAGEVIKDIIKEA